MPSHEQKLAAIGHTIGRIALPILLCSISIHRIAADEVSFNRDIRPILSENCFFCHGPDAEKREADLRLDVREAAIDFGAIVPSDAEASELLSRVDSDDPDSLMPPPRTKKQLTQKEKDLLRRWIDEGAEYQEHWSFRAPAEVVLPRVKKRKWVRNEIDGFILARLENAGLQPAAEAGRETLIRRLSFDLTGLPPTVEEIDEFVEDSAADAYERLVDRLLDSERYGERMASEWLDVARYSDTYGYQVDRDRFVWPWRDWVIRAFNANMPYSQFITEQLAGDLLPDATDDQILATTFNRLHPQKVEGGSTPEEFRIEYVADRSQTFATAFLGLTMECARCHDHKYDPISQKEYYQLTAFFDKIDEAGLYSYFTPSVPTPTLLLADDATKKRLADAARKVAEVEQQLAELAEDRGEDFHRWYDNRRLADEIPGRVAALDFENHKSGANQSVAGRIGKGVRLSGDDGIGLKVGNFRRSEPFSVALWMNTPDEKQRAVVYHRSRAWTDAGSRGYQLLIEEGRLSASLIHFWPGNAIRVKTVEKIPLDKWLHVVVTYDGSSRAEGLRIFVDGKMAMTEVVRDHLYKNITGGGGDNITIGQRFRDRGFTDGLVDEFQVFRRRLTSMEVAQLSGDVNIAKNDMANWQEYYLASVDPDYRGKIEELKRLRQAHHKIADGIQEIMVMRAFDPPRQTYLLTRGAYDQRSDAVQPETPAVFPPFPSDAPRNRLGLARWLTDPAHPLTGRVAVNRYWQMLFGNGLVRTPEDFGSQGQPPTHQQLLDWLARDFLANGWDIKRLLKKMVMSATYRQSAVTTVEHASADPENRLLGRAPSYRWSAEMLRDNALAVSGLLTDRIGGPPAKPYEVEVSFKPTGRDRGDGLYRRSLYTYWKRTGPAPMMMTLDASKRDVCRVRRERTSSPLQAFVLMNSPQFVEAARVLSQRLIEQHGDDNHAVMSDMFRILTSRKPTVAESKVLQDLYDRQFAIFQKNAGLAKEYLANGDAAFDPKIDPLRLAATAVVANTLLNFDQAVMKR